MLKGSIDQTYTDLQITVAPLNGAKGLTTAMLLKVNEMQRARSTFSFQQLTLKAKLQQNAFEISMNEVSKDSETLTATGDKKKSPLFSVNVTFNDIYLCLNSILDTNFCLNALNVI